MTDPSPRLKARAELSDALRDHPDVKDERVEIRTTGSGLEQLVAWYQPTRTLADDSGLRLHLLTRLEPDRQPARLFQVDDVAAATLPTERPRPRMVSAYRAPSTPVEQVIADTWAQLLGVEEVGADDDFYELGGDSLVAIEAVVRLAPLLDPYGSVAVPVELVFLECGTAAIAAEALKGAP